MPPKAEKTAAKAKTDTAEWQSSFKFVRNEIQAIYSTKSTIQIDGQTKGFPGFVTGLLETEKSQYRTLESQVDSSGRWKLQVYRHAPRTPDCLSVYLSLADHPGYPVHVTCTVELRTQSTDQYVKTSRTQYIFPKGGSWGWPSFVSFEDLRHNPEIVLDKTFVIRAEIEEFQSSRDHDYLDNPGINDLKTLVCNFDNHLDAQRDIRILFKDGELLEASSELIDHSNYFDKLLSGDFIEGLDSINDLVPMDGAEVPLFQDAVPMEGEDGAIPESESARRTSSDLSAIGETCSKSSSATEGLANWDTECDSDYEACGERASPVPQLATTERQIKVANFSIATFRAFVFYLRTGIVNFRPLKTSNGNDDVPNNVMARCVDADLRPCSSKSLYRMADYYNESELVELCKTRFMASIWPGNVLLELLQPFGIQHKSITEALEEYAVKNWAAVTETSGFEAAIQAGMEDDDYRKVLMRIMRKAAKA